VCFISVFVSLKGQKRKKKKVGNGEKNKKKKRNIGTIVKKNRER